MPDTEIKICDVELYQVPEVARVHAAAFPNYMNTSLGGPYLRSFIKWFCISSTAIAICALEEDRIVGYAIGAPQGYSKEVTRSLIWMAGFSLLIRPWLWLKPAILRNLAIRLGITAESFSPQDIPALKPPIFSLVGIGVLPEVRGRKVGWKLMNAIEERAVHQMDTKSLKLTVYRDNNARIFYEKLGWIHHDPSPKSPTVVYYKNIW
jgi:ribosomal protein S18 acetylase RimI-like enzyme